MALKQHTILHCGTSRLTLAQVGIHESGAIELEDLAFELLDYDFASEANWLPAVEAGIRALLAGRGGLGPVEVILPGSRILTKSLHIPHVEPDRRRQIIAYEIQQSLPYSIEEIVWDSRIIQDDGIETEILFLAARKGFVETFCRSLASLGLKPVSLGAETVLDNNAARLCLDLGKAPVLVINIGARSSNLTFVTEDRFSVRTLTLGGNQLTQQIAHSLGCPFLQAEHLKLRFFQGDEAFNDADPRVNLIRGHAQQFVQRLNMELTRSLLHYRRQMGGTGVRHVYVTGRGAELPGLGQALEEKQRVPAQVLPVAEAVTLASGLGGEGAHRFDFDLSETIGHAAQSLLPFGASVNLLPEDVLRQQAVSRLKPAILAAAALIALSPLPIWFKYQGNARAYAVQSRQLQTALPQFQVRAIHLDETIRLIERYALTIDRVDDFVHSRTNWVRFFSQLQDGLFEAKDVWLDSLEVSRTVSLVPAPVPEEPEYDGYGEIIQPEPIKQLNYRLSLSGAMLLRQSTDEGEMPVGEDYDEAIISRRIRTLIEQFSESEFIVGAGAPTIRWTRLEDGILPFSFNLTVNPESPL